MVTNVGKNLIRIKRKDVGDTFASLHVCSIKTYLCCKKIMNNLREKSLQLLTIALRKQRCMVIQIFRHMSGLRDVTH